MGDLLPPRPRAERLNMAGTDGNAGVIMRSRALCELVTILMVLPTVQMLQLGSEDAAATATSPVKWAGYAGNPVMECGPAGSWDGSFISVNRVILDDGSYKLYYSGGATGYTQEQIGYATSPDGKRWTKYPGNPVIVPGLTGSWDSKYVVSPAVIKDGDTFKMWYAGFNGNVWRIGYATSMNGQSWTKYSGNPVMETVASNSWESKTLVPCCVIKEHGDYKMWFEGSDGTHSQIGYASSVDGVKWTRYDGNPVLALGDASSWDSWSVGHCTVIGRPGGYRMWFEAYDRQHAGIGHATSRDGLSWTRYGGNPVISRQGTGWQRHSTTDPAVIYNGSGYQIWYAGVDDSTDPWTYWMGYAEGLNPGLLPPILRYPPNNTWTNDSRPVLGWSFQDEAGQDIQAGYQVRISGNDDMATVRYDSKEVLSDQTSHRPASGSPEGANYWRVRAWTGDDECSDWSLPWAIRIDTVPPNASISPLPALVNSINFTVAWDGHDATSGIESYDIQSLDSSGNWSDWLQNSTRTSAIYNGQDGQNCSFRARARDRTGNTGAFSSGVNTTVRTSGILPAPVPSYPPDNAWTNSNRPAFGWSFKDGNGTNIQVAYQLQLGANGGFGTVIYDSQRVVSVVPERASAAQIPDGEYPWRVRAWTDEYTSSDWSTPWKIKVDATPPVASIRSLTRTARTLEVVVNWTGSDATSGVESYDLQMREPGGNWSYWLRETMGTNASYPGHDGQNISFRARARDRAGNLGDYSAAEDILIRLENPGPSISISLPVPNSTIRGKFRASGTSGTDVPGRSVTLVEVKLDDGPWQPASGTLGWSYQVDTGKLPGGDHTLRARAFDGSRYSPEATRTFKVDKLGESVTLGSFPLLSVIILLVTAGTVGTIAYLACRWRGGGPG